MRKFHIILFILSNIFFIWLFILIVNDIDIARTKNNSQINLDVSKAKSFTNIRELKKFTITKIETIKKIRYLRSEQAYTKIYIIISLFFIQMFLYKTNKTYKK